MSIFTNQMSSKLHNIPLFTWPCFSRKKGFRKKVTERNDRSTLFSTLHYKIRSQLWTPLTFKIIRMFTLRTHILVTKIRAGKKTHCFGEAWRSTEGRRSKRSFNFTNHWTQGILVGIVLQVLPGTDMVALCRMDAHLSQEHIRIRC